MKRTTNLPKPNAEAILEAHRLTNPEARFVVGNYLAEQKARKRADMQLRHLGDRDGQPALLQYTADCHSEQEKCVKRMMLRFAEGSVIGRWMLAQRGIGEVISAGLLAHIDITKAPTVGHIWSFAGLKPNAHKEWTKGKKRPWNAELKQVCFSIGDCLKRQHNHPDCFYGAIYAEYKAKIEARNESGGFADKAKTFETTSAEVKKTCATGKVPAGYLDKMAMRYAAKIFLSHLHTVMHFDKFGTVPAPFPHSQLGHIHLNEIPHDDMFPGLREAYRGSVRKAA